MTKLALWWCNTDGFILVARYFLIAAVWLTALLINKRKRNRIAWCCLWLFGLVSLVLAAAPVVLLFTYSEPIGGFTGLALAACGLISFCALLVYIVLMGWTIGFTFTRKANPESDYQH